MVTLVFLLAFVGALLSGYYFYVEQQIVKNPEYKPFCDINSVASCTVAMKSQYAKLLYVPNSILGLLFYISIMMLAVTSCPIMIRYISFLGVIVSIFLAYILHMKIKSFCPICIALYVINFLLFVVSHL